MATIVSRKHPCVNEKNDSMNTEETYEVDLSENGLDINEAIALVAEGDNGLDTEVFKRATNFDFEGLNPLIGLENNRLAVDEPHSYVFEGIIGLDEPFHSHGKWKEHRRYRLQHDKHRPKRFAWDDGDEEAY